jgi:mannose-1-phosphate guanylyltransferase
MFRESHKVRALLLAAGFGERLRPVTEMTPKCLVSIGEKPLLQHWLERLADSHQFDEVIVNTHYLAGEVVKFTSSYRSPIRVKLSYEERLLGPGGTLLKHRSTLAESEFLVGSCG